MSTFRLEILLLLLICWSCTANKKELKKVTIFKEKNFQGDKYEGLSSENCTTIPNDFRLYQGSILTSGCVTFFILPDCARWAPRRGFVIQSGEKSLAESLSRISFRPGLYDPIVSYKNCEGLEKKKTYDVDMHLYNGPTSVRDVCGCNTESSGIYSPVKLYGNCFKFYQFPECSEASNVMQGLDIDFPSDPPFISYEPCQIPLGCGRLTMIAFNLEPALDINSFGGTIKNVAIDVKQTFINNGPGTMEERYEVQRKLKETVTFKVSKSLRSLVSNSKSVSTSYENGTIDKMAATVDASLSTPNTAPVKASVAASAGASKTTTKKLQQAVTDEAKKVNEGSSTEANAHSITTEKSFRVEKTIIIQPCTSYEVSSFVKMAENLEIDYYMHFVITGVSGNGQRMTYENLQIGIENQIDTEERLEVLHGHPRANNVTVVVQLRVQLVANVGMNSVVTGIGAPLEECQRRIEHCNCCDSGEDETDEDGTDETVLKSDKEK